MEEANKLIGAGKKHLVMGKVPEAVNVLQEACSLLAKTYGDTADECGEAFFLCGKSLLDLARMENTVLGNALTGVPEEEEDGDDEPKDSKIEGTENIDEKTRDELRVQVYDAMAAKEEKTADAEKEGEKKEDQDNGIVSDKTVNETKTPAKEGAEDKSQASGDAETNSAEGDKKKTDELEEKMEEAVGKGEEEKKVEGKCEEVKEGNEIEKGDKEQVKGEEEKVVGEEANKKEETEGIKKTDEEVKEDNEEVKEANKKGDEIKEGSEEQVKGEEGKVKEAEGKAEEGEEKMEEGEEEKVGVEKGKKDGIEKDMVSEEKECKEETAKVQKESTDEQEEPSEEMKDGEEGEDDDVEMEGEAEGQGDEGDATADKGSDDEEVGNLQLAWEMLEVAKVIYKRKESKEDQLMAAQSYLKLGEVSSESGNYTQALEDFQECLKIQLKHLDADCRLLAETHYQVGLTHDCLFQYSQATEQFNSSISVINSRLAKLKEMLDKAEGPEALPEERKEMEELQALLPEIQEKVEDAAQAEKENGGPSVSAAIGRNGMDPPASTISPKSPAKVLSVKEEASKTPVSDISHLVRKKRKPEEESPVKEGVAKKVKQSEEEKVHANGEMVHANGEQEKPHTNGDAVASSASKMEVESK